MNGTCLSLFNLSLQTSIAWTHVISVSSHCHRHAVPSPCPQFPSLGTSTVPPCIPWIYPSRLSSDLSSTEPLKSLLVLTKHLSLCKFRTRRLVSYFITSCSARFHVQSGSRSCGGQVTFVSSLVPSRAPISWRDPQCMCLEWYFYLCFPKPAQAVTKIIFWMKYVKKPNCKKKFWEVPRVKVNVSGCKYKTNEFCPRPWPVSLRICSS